MDTNKSGRRGPRHVAGRPKSDRLASKIRQQIAADTHVVAHPNPKKAAALLGLSVRSLERYRNADDPNGSIFSRVLDAIDAAEDPWTVLAFLEGCARRVVEGLDSKPLATLAAEYRELQARDAEGEGEDNAAKVRRGLDWVDRFLTSRRDAKDDLALAAYALEFAYRGVSEAEVLGEVGS